MAFGGWLGQQVSNAGQGVVDAVSDVGSSIDDSIFRPINNGLANVDDFVNESVPGGWAGVILISAGVYYAPEIGAYFDAAGNALTAEQAAAATAEAGTSAAATELTAAEVNALIASEQAAGMTAAEINALIAEEAAAAAAVTPSQAAAAKAAGMSTLDYLKGGMLLNSLVGDPLGLAGEQPSSGQGGSTGFGIVPIPKEWQIPTYAQSAAPIDLNSIFSNQDMLGGTQWQGLQTQQPNISFNDIFAAGQQQTPMGTPVDINQIVSSILGQAATSQKPA